MDNVDDDDPTGFVELRPPDIDRIDFSLYVKTHCWSLSPPEDPGCLCKLLRNHPGKHHCGGCDNEWDSWDESDLTNYGRPPSPNG